MLFTMHHQAKQVLRQSTKLYQCQILNRLHSAAQVLPLPARAAKRSFDIKPALRVIGNQESRCHFAEEVLNG